MRETRQEIADGSHFYDCWVYTWQPCGDSGVWVLAYLGTDAGLYQVDLWAETGEWVGTLHRPSRSDNPHPECDRVFMGPPELESCAIGAIEWLFKEDMCRYGPWEGDTCPLDICTYDADQPW